MSLRTYDPKQVAVIIAGQIISGFADGTFVNVERDEDTWSLQVGADVEATRAKSNNKSGTLTVTLQQGSPSNAVLAALATADELTNTGIFSFLIKDNSGNSLHLAETAYIQKPAGSEYGREAGTREWVIRTDNLTTTPAGN